MMKMLLVSMILMCSIAMQGQSILGKWKTIDDETGKEKSIVEIYEKNGKIFGRIVKLFRTPEEDQDPICDDCADDRKDQRIIGMEIIRDMVQDDDEWEDGTICDPKNGKVYSCGLWLNEDDPDVLMVRGYVAFFFRTQTWMRVK